MIKIFAASGSCFNPDKIIKGKVINKITFVSKEFSGTKDSQKFWDELRLLAKAEQAYIILTY